MNRRGFLGRILLLGAAPLVAKLDWLVAPAPIVLAPTGMVALVEVMMSNESDHHASNTIYRGDEGLLRLNVSRNGGMTFWVMPLGGAIIIPRAAFRHTPTPGVFTALTFYDLDTGEYDQVRF